MRIMGLDVGEKRIGIALSDLMGWTAQGHSVLHRRKIDKDLAALALICTENQVEKLVVGLPLNMNGSLGFKAQEVQEFGKILTEYLQIPLEYIDERLSTVSAERILIQADVSRQKRRQVIDKVAAVYILQTYLDSQ